MSLTKLNKEQLESVPEASTSVKWIVEMATNAEVTTWTDETRYINPKQAKDNYWFTLSTFTTITTPAWTSSTPQYSISTLLWRNSIINIRLSAISSWTNTNIQWVQYSLDNINWVDWFTRTGWWWLSVSEDNFCFSLPRWVYIRVFQWWIGLNSADCPVTLRWQNS